MATDTDLRYRVSASGVKEEIVLRSARAPHSFQFHLADPTGQLGAVTAQPDGSYKFTTPIDDDVTAAIAPAFAYEDRSARWPYLRCAGWG